MLIPYGHTHIHNVFKMFYLRNQVLPKQILEHSGGHHEAWEVLKDLLILGWVFQVPSELTRGFGRERWKAVDRR